MKRYLPLFFYTLIIPLSQSAAQVVATAPNEYIAVSVRPSPDSVSIRWAPLTFAAWRLATEHGYRIERYLISRNGALSPGHDRAILHNELKPRKEMDWASIVPNDKYAAIAAQALFGDRFEVDLQQSDAFSIVNKVQENEQRFAFALFAADMSINVARASGLYFADKSVRSGEKYLYRIIVAGYDTLRGSVFVSPDDPYVLYPPLNLTADFQDKIVSLKWDKSASAFYSAYVVERSEDGNIFNRVSDEPLTTVTPTEADEGNYEYAIDTLPDVTQKYHYRVRGLTPFGEAGPPSNSVHGKGTVAVEQVPYITFAESQENRSIDIRWEFPSTSNNAILGFEVKRAHDPTGQFLPLTQVLLAPDKREFTDLSPGQSNYYKVLAHGRNGDLYSSHLYLAQLVDSIPPTSPSGLAAEVSDDGKVALQWKPNSESDIYGYRIYKAYYESEELAQVTSEPVTQTLFADLINLNTLNEYVYYAVMGVDVNQNHSALSELLKVKLPDKVRPQPPVFLSVKSDPSGISLSWLPGASKDIVEYKVYRKMQEQDLWEVIQSVPAGKDSIYHFYDENLEPGLTAFYTLVSVDDAGLESNPSPAMRSKTPVITLVSCVVWKRPQLIKEENKLTLKWECQQPHVNTFRIYRSVDEKPLILLTNIKGIDNEFTDSIIPGTNYTYRIMALFENGQKSSVSDKLEFSY